MKDNNRPRLDYYVLFSKVDTKSVDIAYKNAESMFDDYSNQIVIGSLELNKYRNLESMIDSDSEEEGDCFNIYDYYGDEYSVRNYYD